MSTESTHELLESNDPVTSTTTNGEINPSALSSDRYLHKCIYDACKPRWSAFAGVDDEEADLNARTAHVPIIHHHEFVDHGWKTSAISIQDQAMRQVLTQVLDGYQDLDPGLEDWKFSSPFRPLVHRWDLLKSMELELPDGPLKDAVKLLSSFLTSRLTSSLTSLEQTKTTGKLQFDNVWQIFAPGSVVTTKIFREDVICRVVRYSFDDDSLPPRWNIDVEYVDWNGKSTGYVPKTVSISMFAGFRRVTNLPVFPISFLSNLTKLKERFIERGRKFERLRGYKYMLCNGTKVLLETEMPELRPIAAKVCIDAYAYHRSCNLIKLPLRALVDREEEETPDQANVDDAEDSDTPFGSDISMAPVKISGEDLRRENLEPLSDEQCLMTTPWMKGFDLKSKHWCELRVNDLQEMTWNDEAFEKLVLPNGEKDLAWSFVENKILSQGQFDDFIPDKGRGLIILMFGPPGVGKTFTAEAVAERSRVPLYSVSAGELGTEPSEVETALERALELCRMWNAMLLLDEADIFLGTRTNDSLARNELVSSKPKNSGPSY
jgi:hypothetical protein